MGPALSWRERPAIAPLFGAVTLACHLPCAPHAWPTAPEQPGAAQLEERQAWGRGDLLSSTMPGSSSCTSW